MKLDGPSVITATDWQYDRKRLQGAIDHLLWNRGWQKRGWQIAWHGEIDTSSIYLSITDHLWNNHIKRAPAKNLNRERPSLQQHLAESQLHLTANGFLIGTYTSEQTRNWLSVSGTWWKVGRLVIGHVLFMSISILYCVGAFKGFWRSCVRRFLATGALCSWV